MVLPAFLQSTLPCRCGILSSSGWNFARIIAFENTAYIRKTGEQ
jgi:hypothetical protein